MLIDGEEDRTLRAVLVGMLREIDSSGDGLHLVRPQSELLCTTFFATWSPVCTITRRRLKTRASPPGTPLALVAEPDNRYDSDEIGVWNADRREGRERRLQSLVQPEELNVGGVVRAAWRAGGLESDELFGGTQEDRRRIREARA